MWCLHFIQYTYCDVFWSDVNAFAIVRQTSRDIKLYVIVNEGIAYLVVPKYTYKCNSHKRWDLGTFGPRANALSRHIDVAIKASSIARQYKCPVIHKPWLHII